MGKALIVYTSRSGQTERIAQLVGEGIRFGLGEAEIKNAADIKSEADLEGYDALILGSPTYHGDMVSAMKQILFLAEKADLEGKIGGAFGAFGWSGEAIDRIHQTMEHIFKMDTSLEALRLKSPDLGGAMQMAQGYGKEIAARMAG